MSKVPDESQITLHPRGGVTVEGKDGMLLMKALVLKGSLKLYAKTKMIPTRGVSGAAMLKMATEFTKKKYKRGEHMKAHDDLQIWCDTMKAAIPTEDNRDPE